MRTLLLQLWQMASKARERASNCFKDKTACSHRTPNLTVSYWEHLELEGTLVWASKTKRHAVIQRWSCCLKVEREGERRRGEARGEEAKLMNWWNPFPHLQHTAWITKNKMMTTMKGKSVRDDVMMNLAFYLLGNPSILQDTQILSPWLLLRMYAKRTRMRYHAEFT